MHANSQDPECQTIWTTVVPSMVALNWVTRIGKVQAGSVLAGMDQILHDLSSHSKATVMHVRHKQFAIKFSASFVQASTIEFTVVNV